MKNTTKAAVMCICDEDILNSLVLNPVEETKTNTPENSQKYRDFDEDVGANTILLVLVDHGVDLSYIPRLANCYENVQKKYDFSIDSYTTMHNSSLDMDEKGIRIDGKFLSYLRLR
ncbi:hypothetical protein KIN20_013915 [Parelaphostrongylus tenuis]|uniref:Uncharacterized protein n=1 Tax=Parelaphostrongylus tenuis TaxID=148309 RepID=A0AAD5ME80_PARTN|nr:hypothetical protein KIN20_013915 [Parelaphostrongylus tenuis]